MEGVNGRVEGVNGYRASDSFDGVKESFPEASAHRSLAPFQGNSLFPLMVGIEMAEVDVKSPVNLNKIRGKLAAELL